MYEPSTRVEGAPIQEGIVDLRYLNARYLRERGGDFTDTRLSAKLGATAADTMLLLPPELSGVDVESNDTDFAVHLTAIPELAVGRRNSRAEVQFGQLHITGGAMSPMSELVAAKYIHRLSAPRELQAALTINRRFGANVAYTPLGFVTSPTGTVGYLSRYEHSVVSLDNVLWNETAPVEQRERAMGLAGLWLASLHNHGIVHGDAQAKNIAYDSSNMPRYIDLEGASELGHGNPDTKTQRLLDLQNLFHPTYMPPTSPDEGVIFVDSYIDHQAKQSRPLRGEDIIDTIAHIQMQ